MLFLHIGLPRTSSTSLNDIYFKQLKYFNIEYLNKKKKLLDNNFEKMIYSKNKYLISDVELMNFDPHNWLKNLVTIKNKFGKNISIIFFIRKPSDYCNSVFLQYCIKQFNIRKEEDFFLETKSYHISKNNFKFDIDQLNYNKVIKFIKNNFNQFKIIKYEDFSLMDLHQYLIGDKIYDEKFEIINKKFTHLKKNKSFSYINVIISINLFYFFKKTFLILKINLIIKFFFKIYLIYLAKYLKKYNYKEIKKIIKNKNIILFKKNEFFLYDRIISLAFNNIFFHFFLNFISIFFKKKYLISLNNNIKKKLNLLDIDYENIRFSKS